jgi:hypothetical protein
MSGVRKCPVFVTFLCGLESNHLYLGDGINRGGAPSCNGTSISTRLLSGFLITPGLVTAVGVYGAISAKHILIFSWVVSYRWFYRLMLDKPPV